MYTSTTTTLLALFTTSTLAFPHLQPRQASSSTSSSSSSSATYPAWHPPGPSDVRGPCPALNTLANHDICPRNGKNYTLPILLSCLATGMNIGYDFTTVIGAAGIASNPDPEALYFDLDMLDAHNHFIEHDGSLSRADASTGNDYTFNSSIWDTVLAYLDSGTDATVTTAGPARLNRVQTAEKTDPDFSYGPTQLLFSYGESALYLSAMGDPVTGVAPVEYVRSLFEEERLPYEEGWTAPTTATTLITLGALIVRLNAADGSEVPEGLALGAGSYRAALMGLNAITGEVESAGLYAVAELMGAVDVE